MQNTEVFEAYVGMDVHKESIAVAIANPERGGEVRFYGVPVTNLQYVTVADFNGIRAPWAPWTGVA